MLTETASAARAGRVSFIGSQVNSATMPSVAEAILFPIIASPLALPEESLSSLRCSPPEPAWRRSDGSSLKRRQTLCAQIGMGGFPKTPGHIPAVWLRINEVPRRRALAVVKNGHRRDLLPPRRPMPIAG